MPTAQTHVTTARASRYLVQLCEHLDQIGGHARHGDAAGSPGIQRVECSDTRGVIVFRSGQCSLAATDAGLTVSLSADDQSELERMQQMFTMRLETIGRRDGIAVDWGPSAGERDAVSPER